MRKQSIARFLVVLGFSVFLAACGSSTTTDKGEQVDPPVVDNATTTGLHVYTNTCTTANACADITTYQIVLNIEWQRPGDFAWIKIGEVDTGALGEVILGMPTPGTYRLKAKTAPVGSTNPSVTEVVVKDLVKPVILTFERP